MFAEKYMRICNINILLNDGYEYGKYLKLYYVVIKCVARGSKREIISKIPIHT